MTHEEAELDAVRAANRAAASRLIRGSADAYNKKQAARDRAYRRAQAVYNEAELAYVAAHDEAVAAQEKYNAAYAVYVAARTTLVSVRTSG